MISQLHIKNFKSIVDLTLDLGRVNLFIGENGCGKSNILEAVAFATEESTLGKENFIDDYTKLASKGVRITNPELFQSAFSNHSNDIEFEIVIDNNPIRLHYKYRSADLLLNIEDAGWQESTMLENRFGLSKLQEQYGPYIDFVGFASVSDQKLIDNVHVKDATAPDLKKRIIDEIKRLDDYFRYRNYSYLIRYVIYSPENSYLRKFEEEGQVRPLGIKGEGLFSLLKSISKDNGSIQHIKEYMEAIDWFEDFSIPNDLMSNEYKIAIKDRFINSDLMLLDQRSANEGFLFLLFYVVLFSSKRTPKFFAVDNIEASFNPKLCAKLITILTELSKKNEKQVLMTTHNPATLDGLDLNDPEQRLFVVRRNIDGHTIATRITEKPKVSTAMRLSEMWTKGLLGGLPDNF